MIETIIPKNWRPDKGIVKTKDISFSNLFLKKFVICFAITIPIMIAAYVLIGNITEEIQTEKINNRITEYALDLIQLENSAMASDRKAMLTNVWLSEYQEELKDNPFITDSSLSFYNLSGQKLIAKSFEIFVLNDEKAREWWEKEADLDDGVPRISMSNEMLEFCKTHRDKKIVINSMACLNTVICVEELTIYDGDKIVQTLKSELPSVVTNDIKYTEATEIKLIGNKTGDTIYTNMIDHKFITTEKQSDKQTNTTDAEKVDMTQKDVEEELGVLYLEEMNKEKISTASKKFTLDEQQFQLDCLYQFNFWHGAWGYVLATEFFMILLCALLSFLMTKSAYDIFGD